MAINVPLHIIRAKQKQLLGKCNLPTIKTITISHFKLGAAVPQHSYVFSITVYDLVFGLPYCKSTFRVPILWGKLLRFWALKVSYDGSIFFNNFWNTSRWFAENKELLSCQLSLSFSNIFFCFRAATALHHLLSHSFFVFYTDIIYMISVLNVNPVTVYVISLWLLCVPNVCFVCLVSL